jgi:hypothetical protein
MNYKQRENKRLELQSKRDVANLRLDILCKGIGHKLANGYGYSAGYTDELRSIITIINIDLINVIKASEDAEKAFEPFRKYRRRSRMYNIRHRKTLIRKAAKKVSKLRDGVNKIV